MTRVTLHGGVCPCCARKFKAPPPADMPTGSPFGPNLRALVIYLRFTQGIALERLSTLLSDILGLDIIRGRDRQHARRRAPGFRRANKRASARVCCREPCWNPTRRACGSARRTGGCGSSTTRTTRSSSPNPRGARKWFRAFLGDWRPDFWVSDRYGGQLGWAAKDNQVCLAHLIRDAQYAIDAGDAIFAPDLRHLLGRACRIGRRRERLADATLKTYAARLEARLDDLMARKPTHAAGVKFQQVIRKVRRHLFVFMTNRAIPPTNNGSERALRPCVTFRKITNGFRTEWGARLYADIRSVIETGRRRAIGALDAVRLTLAGKPLQAPM